jgi:hypothetical protein
MKKNVFSTSLVLFTPLAFILAGHLAGQSLSPISEVKLNFNYRAPFPVWTGGAIVGYENNFTRTPVIHSYDAEGTEMQPIAFSLPGAAKVVISGVARSADGSYAVAGSSWDSSGRSGGFITWISADRQTLRTVRPFPYIPDMIAIAPDGSIWTVGAERVNGTENDPAVNRSHGVVRHFSASGIQLADFIPRRQLFSGRAMGQGIVASNHDRIGWYAIVEQRYVEVTFDGKVAAYPGIAPPGSDWQVNGVALLDDGGVIASARAHNATSGSALYRLDRSTKTWVAMNAPEGESQPIVLGSDGSRILLFSVKNWTNTFELTEFGH